MMKFWGYSNQDKQSGKDVPSAMAEITLMAHPDELRQIANFLRDTANEMERHGKHFGHEHLADRMCGFSDAPQLIVCPPDTSS